MYRQYELSSGDRRLTCWLEYQPNVKKGTIITLKQFKTIPWMVLQVGRLELPSAPAIDWKVGGLK